MTIHHRLTIHHRYCVCIPIRLDMTFLLLQNSAAKLILGARAVCSLNFAALK